MSSTCRQIGLEKARSVKEALENIKIGCISLINSAKRIENTCKIGSYQMRRLPSTGRKSSIGHCAIASGPGHYIVCGRALKIADLARFQAFEIPCCSQIAITSAPQIENHTSCGVHSSALAPLQSRMANHLQLMPCRFGPASRAIRSRIWLLQTANPVNNHDRDQIWAPSNSFHCGRWQAYKLHKQVSGFRKWAHANQVVLAPAELFFRHHPIDASAGSQSVHIKVAIMDKCLLRLCPLGP